MKIRDSLIIRILREIPDLNARLERFTVDTSDVDDELMALFIRQMQMDIDAIQDALTRGDLVELANRSHSIKGMGGTADMPELSVLAEDLEKAGKTGNADRVRKLNTVLCECFVLVKESHV